jgi:GMP synthase (glutamine-hydrolysing)
VVITHVGFEGPDALGAILRDAGFELHHVDACVDVIDTAQARSADLLVVMGGPIGVYEEDRYPFLIGELTLLEGRLGAKRHTLGICLGAQLIARVLGAEVHQGVNGKEIGWERIQTPSPSSLLSAMALEPVLHWHGDTFDLPLGAELLASSARYANQAFRHEATTLAFQFHPEVTAAGLERWWVGHAGEIAYEGLAIAELRAGARRHAGAANAALRDVLGRWLPARGTRQPPQGQAAGRDERVD